MGYDVKVIELKEIECYSGIEFVQIVKEEFSMTYNFSVFKKDWYLPDEMNGQTGKQIASKIKTVLNKYFDNFVCTLLKQLHMVQVFLTPYLQKNQNHNFQYFELYLLFHHYYFSQFLHF